jgi:glycosyltransferase involved in cell wall biosynthesis
MMSSLDHWKLKCGTSSTLQPTNSSPLVSVCVPTYNGMGHLEEALASIDSQDYPNLEVVFSDDGSTDGTVERIHQYANNSRFEVKLLRHQHTSLAGNWNNCVANASGAYIKFLFQDDLMQPNCISRMMELAMRDPGIVLVFTPREIVFEGVKDEASPAWKIAQTCAVLHTGWFDLREIQEGPALLADPALLDGVWNKIGEPSIVLLKRQALIDVGGFDPNLCQLIDLDMWYHLMATGKVGFVDETLSSFRIHDKQLSVDNAHSGKASNDNILFARKVVHSPFFGILHPAARKKFLKLIRPQSAFKVQRRRLKRWLAKRVLGR